jgi:hypothetical protein
MSANLEKDLFSTTKVLNLVMQERAKALSAREWKHRLAGYGYAIKETCAGQVIATLPHGVEVCALPPEMAA